MERYHDKLVLNDKVNQNKPHSLLKTDVIIKTYDGNKLISVRKHRQNMTVLGGRLDILEKTFGIKVNTAQHLFLNDMIPLPLNATLSNGVWTDPFPNIENGEGFTTIDSSNTPGFNLDKDTFFDDDLPDYKGLDRRCQWWCIGNGGENPVTPYTIHQVHDWETRLYRMVPFRFLKIGNDLTAQERQNYRLRKEVSLGGITYIAYFAKKFDPGLVTSLKNADNYLPGDPANFPASLADSEPLYGDAAQQSQHPWNNSTSSIFIEFNLEVGTNEFKEYYMATHQNQLVGARLSELGILSAYDFNLQNSQYNELAFSEVFAKITHDLVFLSSANSRRVITYRISV